MSDTNKSINNRVLNRHLYDMYNQLRRKCIESDTLDSWIAQHMPVHQRAHNGAICNAFSLEWERELNEV